MKVVYPVSVEVGSYSLPSVTRRATRSPRLRASATLLEADWYPFVSAHACPTCRPLRVSESLEMSYVVLHSILH